MSFAGMHHQLARSVFILLDARFKICRTLVSVSVHMGVGWKLYYDAYRIYQCENYLNIRLNAINCFPSVIRYVQTCYRRIDTRDNITLWFHFVSVSFIRKG